MSAPDPAAGPQRRLPPRVDPPTAAQIADESAFGELVAKSLDNTRESAKKWRDGLGALVTLVTAALLVKGPADAADMPVGWRIAVTGLLGAGLVLAVCGLWQALAADAGMPKPVTYEQIVREHGSVLEFEVAQSVRAARRLAAARRFVAVSLAAFIAGMLAWWWAPAKAAEPVVTVTLTSGQDVCGKLVSADGRVVRVLPEGASTAVAVPFARVRNLAVSASCP